MRKTHDWIRALCAALALLGIAAFVIFVIQPGGFEGQIGWFFALMPGAFLAAFLEPFYVTKIVPAADGIVWWPLMIGGTFFWYFAVSFAVIKAYRLLVRAFG